MFSKRANTFLGEPEFLLSCLSRCGQDPFDKISNKEGFVNLGTAVNSLCEDVIKERFDKGDLFSHEASWQHYVGLNGTEDLLTVVAQFLSDRMAQSNTISPSNIRLVNGVSAGLEVLSWILADPGEVVLVPVPTYARFFADMNERMKTQVVGIHLRETPSSMFTLTPELLEEEILAQHQRGKHVKGFIFCNPNNPLGVVYPKTLTLGLMEVCKKYKVHFISDEIYGLSVFDPSVNFESVLSIPKEQIPDPERTHFMWGMSKDFGLAGFRMGFIHSYNKDMIKCLDGMMIYTSVSVHIQQFVSKMLQDTVWLDQIYFPANISRLSSSYSYVAKRLSDLRIPVIPAQAGLFCWADFSLYLDTQTQEGELKLFRKFFDEYKVYLVPGSMFGCEVVGWFRIIFAVGKERLEEGLDRIERAIQKKSNL
eukprot:TRINITY_DN11811_c0_g1_i4.p1 TRINITY_DN11811_c0_g1~~TRINITY_DN11811_c0_g1_i4.p1  ORF type:complete len:423 (-),score=100.76 TRINITY_DN11811_c0_g1_i4:67-1335(-)